MRLRVRVCVHVCLRKRAKKQPHAFGGLTCRGFYTRLWGSLHFSGSASANAHRGLCPPPPHQSFKTGCGLFLPPVIPCPLRFHFAGLRLITSLSGLREVMCCTSLPGSLPGRAAISPDSSVSPSEVCSPSPTPPQPFPCPGMAGGEMAEGGKMRLRQDLPFPDLLSGCRRHLCQPGPLPAVPEPRREGSEGRGGEGRGEAAFPAGGAASRRERRASVYLDTSSKAAVLGSICRGCQDP